MKLSKWHVLCLGSWSMVAIIIAYTIIKALGTNLVAWGWMAFIGALVVFLLWLYKYFNP